MIKKQTTSALLAAIALQASVAHGLGLGDISLHSRLDEPLSAEIRLRGVGDLNPAQILVSLGSPGDFERAGVERAYSLFDIQFDVELTGDGNGVVRLSSGSPIQEPYLDFVVEVRWPSGRLLREYTVLLDLPLYGAEAPQRVTAASVSAREGEAGGFAEGQGGISGGEYKVVSGDTLWSIASRSRPAGVSPQQMMEAIHRNNPDAFVDGDVNRLRAGRVLRMPEGSDLAALSQMPAREALPTQPGAQAAAGEAAGAAPASAGGGEGYLAIASDEAAQPGAVAAGGTAGWGDATAQLSAAQESLAAATRENQELQGRVAALEEQVENYQKLVDLKSEGIGTAQQPAEQVAAAPEEAAVPARAEPPAAAEPGLVEKLLGNSIVLVTAAGALLLGLLAFLFKRKRSVEEFVPAAARPLRPAEPAVPSAAAQRREAVAPAAAPQPVDVADPVGEAEIYLAYGRQERAMEILNDALGRNPGATDARLKLMEIHAERGEKDEFVRNFGALGADAGARNAARQLLETAGHQEWIAGPQPAVDLGAELRQAAPDLSRSDREAMLAKTGDAIARAAAELEGGLEPDLDRGRVERETRELPEIELPPLGEIELGGAGLVTAEDSALRGGEAVDADLDFLKGTDEVQTKLELARAYVDMGDLDGARDILEEVVEEGTPEQREQASALLDRIRI